MSTTKIIKQQFQVSINFDLIFTEGVFDNKNLILKELLSNDTFVNGKAIVIVDKGVSDAHTLLKESIKDYFSVHSSEIELCGEVLEVPGGEQSKNNNAYLKKALKSINEFGIDRHSYVVVIGGGAVLDAVGFAASIAHRGVRLIRIPTTILSQNDSGIGVKNGVNYFGKKNFIGSFSSPYAVINDCLFLETLEDRDWRSGISEAIKVALIKDYDFFHWIESHTEELNRRDKEVMNELIYRCADLHLKHIQNSGDAYEQGSSRPLDFGHWAAHKLEQLSNYNIRHGEAVAVGIALDSTYSFLKGHINKEALDRILNCILKLGFKISYKEFDTQIVDGLEEFREHLGGELTIMLLESLGLGFEVHSMDEKEVLKAIDYMINYKLQ